MPQSDPSGWQISLGKRDGSFFAAGEGLSFDVYAICVSVAG
jgi:hypothetical protein